jgi:NDP-sugar pyrophosphorylase family protein
MRLEYSVEETPLGTAGALRHARPFLDDTFLVLNGDSFADVNLRELARYHMERGAAATIALAAVPDTSNFGRAQIDSSCRLIAFEEKRVKGPGLVNAGIYVLETRLLELVPAGRPVSLELETLPLLVEQGIHVYGHRFDGRLVDIGTPEGYALSQELLRGLGT